MDLTWNKLQNTREDVSILRKHCPVLHTLDVRHNDWQKVNIKAQHILPSVEFMKFICVHIIDKLRLFHPDKKIL